MRLPWTSLGTTAAVLLGACGDRDTTPEPPRLEMAEAIDLVAQGDCAAAEPALERILRDHVGPPVEVHFYLGYCAGTREDFADAEMHYRESLRRDPALFEARLNLGNVLFLQGRNDEALAMLENLTEAYPEEPDAFVALAEQQLAMGLGEEALASFRRVTVLTPEDPLPWSAASEALAQLGRPDERIALLQEALRATDHHAIVAIDLSRALTAAGRGDEAVVTLVEASASSANDAAHVGALALELRDMGRLDDGMTVAQVGIDRAADDGDLRLATLTLAQLARDAGRVDVAEPALRAGLSRLPGERSMTYFLGALLAQERRCDEAVPLLREALAAWTAEDPASAPAQGCRAALAACGAAVE